MSRHRRQASQALPPELFAGDDLTKPFDFTQSITGEAGTAATATVSLSQASRIQTHQEIKGSPLTTTSPAKNKAPPAAKSA
ncbi:hypothetical protein E2542_SST21590 [Spatholobus suberectus]|nr:hypothetical protein E2542_SST21590 [Spatholobus suberectus]